jgi:hypothetical protein
MRQQHGELEGFATRLQRARPYPRSWLLLQRQLNNESITETVHCAEVSYRAQQFAGHQIQCLHLEIPSYCFFFFGSSLESSYPQIRTPDNYSNIRRTASSREQVDVSTATMLGTCQCTSWSGGLFCRSVHKLNPQGLCKLTDVQGFIAVRVTVFFPVCVDSLKTCTSSRPASKSKRSHSGPFFTASIGSGHKHVDLRATFARGTQL